MAPGTGPFVLAQHGGGDAGGSGDVAMTILLVTVLVVIWIAVGVVCWIFWRAKKRDDAVKASEEPEWRNAPSS